MDTDSDQGNEDVGYLGGLLRGVLRGIGYITRIESIGRLPVRIPHKVVSKSADRLSQLHDTHQMMTDAYEAARRMHPESRIKSIMQTALVTSHGIIKSAILGGALFAVYEESIDRLIQHQYFSDTADSSRLVEFVCIPALYSSCVGAIAGMGHGICFSLWDKAIHSTPRVRQSLHAHLSTRPKRSYTLGTAASHTLVHGALFGSYELFKRGSLHAIGLAHRDDHLSRIEGGLCVMMGGLSAGALSDAVGRVTEAFEEAGLRDGISRFRTASRSVFTLPKYGTIGQSVRRTMRTAFPTMLGFLAFEYARGGFSGASDDGEYL